MRYLNGISEKSYFQCRLSPLTQGAFFKPPPPPKKKKNNEYKDSLSIFLNFMIFHDFLENSLKLQGEKKYQD